MTNLCKKNKITNFLAVSLLCLLFATTVSITFFKVPSCLSIIADTFSLEKAEASQLMSAYTLGGLISVVFAGFFVNKFGARNSLMTCVVFSALGSVLGAFAGIFGENALWALFCCRLCEGFLNTFTSICMPIIIVDVVDPKRVGISITLYACWMSLGTVLSQTYTPLIMNALGFTTTWLLFAFLSVITGAIIWIFVAPAPNSPKTTYYAEKAKKTVMKEMYAAQNGSSDKDKTKKKFRKHKKEIEPLMTRPIVGSCVVFLLMYGIMCLASISITNYIPTCLQMYDGLDESTSGFYASIPSIVTMFVQVLLGLIYDRTGRYKSLLIICCLLGTIGIYFMFEADSMKIFFAGAGVSGIAFSVFSICAIVTNDLFGRKRMETGMTLLVTMGVLGQFAGSTVIAMILGQNLANFELAGIVLSAGCLVSTVLAAFIVPRKVAIKRAIIKFINPKLSKIK